MRAPIPIVDGLKTEFVGTAETRQSGLRRFFSKADRSSASASTVQTIFQILILDEPGLPQPLSAKVSANIQSVKIAYPKTTHHLLNGAEARAFLTAHFDSDVVDAYDTLRPYAYKCDLARLCLLLVYGGLYVDLGLRLCNRLQPPPGTGLVAFRDLLGSYRNSWSVLNGLLLVTPGRPELRLAIDLIVQNCRDKYYGSTPLDPTGPGLLGRALVLGNTASDHWIGNQQAKSSRLLGDTFVLITPDRQRVAVSTKTEGGNFSALGITGTNNYNEFWHARRVYGEPN